MARSWIALALSAIALLVASSASADPGNGRVFDPDSPQCTRAAEPAHKAPPRSGCGTEVVDDPADEVPLDDETAVETDDVVADDDASLDDGYFMLLGDAVRYTPPRRCHVPRVIGMKRAKARRTLKRAGCRVGKTRGRRAHGRVRRQSVRAGAARAAGFRVDLTFR
jgi:hypothetical protein